MQRGDIVPTIQLWPEPDMLEALSFRWQRVEGLDIRQPNGYAIFDGRYYKTYNYFAKEVDWIEISRQEYTMATITLLQLGEIRSY